MGVYDDTGGNCAAVSNNLAMQCPLVSTLQSDQSARFSSLELIVYRKAKQIQWISGAKRNRFPFNNTTILSARKQKLGLRMVW